MRRSANTQNVNTPLPPPSIRAAVAKKRGISRDGRSVEIGIVALLWMPVGRWPKEDGGNSSLVSECILRVAVLSMHDDDRDEADGGGGAGAAGPTSSCETHFQASPRHHVMMIRPYRATIPIRPYDEPVSTWLGRVGR